MVLQGQIVHALTGIDTLINKHTFNTTIKAAVNLIDIPAIEYLYIETFSKGVSAQFVDKADLNIYLKSILEDGVSLSFIEQNKLIACLLYTTLSIDNLCPLSIINHFNIEKCAYIAEVMVDEHYRGQGLGKALIETFFDTVNTNMYTEVFIRVWDQNIPAVQLYLKMGFSVIANIQQTKKTLTGDSEFSMNKLYLHKHLHKPV